MGLIASITEKIRIKHSHEKIVHLIEFYTKHKRKFAFDANYYVVLAQAHDDKTLFALVDNDYHFMTVVTMSELRGITNWHALDRRSEHLLKDFIRRYIKAHGIPNFKNPTIIKQSKAAFAEYSEIVPRKIAYEAIGDYFLRQLRLIQAGEKDEKTAKREWNDEHKVIISRKLSIKIKRDQLAKKLKIKFGTKLTQYEKDCMKWLSDAYETMQKIVNKNVPIAYREEQIEKLIAKGYDKDLQYVIESLAANVKPHSFDNDVYWLHEFFVLKAA